MTIFPIEAIAPMMSLASSCLIAFNVEYLHRKCEASLILAHQQVNKNAKVTNMKTVFELKRKK